MDDDAAICTALAAETRRLAGMGLMACTSGNASARLCAGPMRVAVTPSGRDKSGLQPADLLVVDAAGRVCSGSGRPSDEMGLHLALMEAVGCGAVAHGHPPNAVALSLAVGDRLDFAGIEMLKAFAGIRTHDLRATLPVVDNSQDMGCLADLVLTARRSLVADHVLPAVLVRGHGVYAWGDTPDIAGRHLEAVEWLCRVRILGAAIPVMHL